MSRFIVNKKKEQERSQLNDIPLEDYIESMAKNELCYFINERYQTKPIIAYLKKKGFYETDMNDKWSYRARLAFVVNLNEIDYARFKIGFHMVNKIPTLYRLNVAKNMAKV